MLKKFIVGMSCFALIATMTSCGKKDDSNTSDKTTVSSTESAVTSEEETIDITAPEDGGNDVIYNMLTNLKDVDSVEATLDIKMNMELITDGETYSIPITLSGTNTKSENITYANITSTEDLSALGQEVTTTVQEQYSVKNEDNNYTLYSKYIYNDRDYETDWIVSESTEESSIIESVEIFEKATDKAKIEKTTDGYKITIDMNDLDSEDTKDITMGTGITGDFVVYLNQDYYPVKISIENVDMTDISDSWLSDDDLDIEAVNMTFEFTVTFDNWNSVEKITIPNEVVSNAAEYQVNIATE